jgi:hypothetical protein
MDLYWEGTKWDEAWSNWISTHIEKNRFYIVQWDSFSNNTWWWPNTAETCRARTRIRKFYVVLKTVVCAWREYIDIFRFWLKSDKSTKSYPRIYVQLERNSLNACRSDRYFRRKFQREMEQMFYTQHKFPATSTASKITEEQRAMKPLSYANIS